MKFGDVKVWGQSNVLNMVVVPDPTSTLTVGIRRADDGPALLLAGIGGDAPWRTQTQNLIDPTPEWLAQNGYPNGELA